MFKSLNKIRFVMFGVAVIYLIALTYGSLIASKEVGADQSAAMSDSVVLDAAWPAGVLNNIVRMNYFAMEPRKVLVLSFPGYGELEARRIDHFPEAPLQADSSKATPD